MKASPKSLPPAPVSAPADRNAVKTTNSTEAALDAALVRRFKAGDEAAFTEIVQRHYARIRILAHQTLHNIGDAEEVAQDTFIRAHRALHNFRGDCTLLSWLYRIGLNLARNRYWHNFRRHRQDALSLDRAMDDEGSINLASLLSDGTAIPRSESITNEFMGLVAECMERLDAAHRDILLMRTSLNLSYEEIASRLRINVGTVKSRVARARERLRDMLRQLAPEFGCQATTADFFEIHRPHAAPGFALA